MHRQWQREGFLQSHLIHLLPGRVAVCQDIWHRLILIKKGFVRLLSGGNNSIRIELTDKADQYAEEMGERHLQSLKLLFSDFSDDEIKQLFHLYVKLFAGMERVEKYAEELD